MSKNNKLIEIDPIDCKLNLEKNYHLHMYVIRTGIEIQIGENLRGKLGDLWIQIYN